MRFALKTAPEMTTWEAMLACWLTADDIELFESGWTFDHFYPIYADRSGPCLEAWTTLAALAQATTRIRVGCLVSGVLYRHPAVLANMIATLDHISGGRLEIGLGAGWMEPECEAYGIELGTITERLDRFDEACEVITGLLTAEQVSFAGRWYTLTDAYCAPKPVQTPRPPICIGGAGERRVLRSVARFADHWNFPGGTAADFAHKRTVLAAHCDDLGRDPATITTSVHLYVDANNPLEALPERAAEFADAGCDLGIVYLFGPDQRPDKVEQAAMLVAPLAG